MPKETFFNLTEDKRQRIIDIALEEFAIHDYKTASLSRVVERAEIAKGSMYQYFENKKDLYLYLIQISSQKKLDYINVNIGAVHEDFFEMYKQMIIVAARFDFKNPKYSRILYNAGREVYNEDLGDMGQHILKVSDKYIGDFIKSAQDRNEIRKDIPVDMMAFIVSRLSVYIGEYIEDKYNFSRMELIDGETDSMPIRDEDLDSVLEDLIRFFKNGLKG